MRYILVDREPVPCEDLMTWGRWFNTADRHVALTEINGVTISTVFLGLDHNFTGGGQPILYETMVFGGALDQEQERYCTWAEAEAGHQRWVEAVKASEAFPEELEIGESEK